MRAVSGRKGKSLDVPGRRVLVYGITAGFAARPILRGQLAWLVNKGWGVILVTGSHESDAFAESEGARPVTIRMKRDPSLVSDVLALAGWIHLLAGLHPQAVNVGTPKAGFLGMLAAWLVRVPRRVYTMHGLRLETAAGLSAVVLAALERLTCRLATDVVFVSESLAKEGIRRRLVPPGRSRIIGSGSCNGVDSAGIMLRVGTIDRDALRSQLGIPADELVVGFMGRVTADKGIGTLLEAFETELIVPRVGLLIIGRIEEPGLLDGAARSSWNLHTVPWSDDPWAWLPAMDLLCLPSLREGFPNAVLEAAAAGIPAITTRATGAVDSVVDGVTGFLVDVLDVKALADRINTLARDSDLREAMGAAARQRVIEAFQPERTWRGLESIINGELSDDVRRA